MKKYIWFIFKYYISKNSSVPDIPAKPVPLVNPEAVMGSKAFKNPKIVVEPSVWLKPINGKPIRQNINLSITKEKIINNNPKIELPVINIILVVCLNCTK